MRKKLGQLSGEALAIAKQGRLMLRPKRRVRRAPAGRVVAFVHGYGAAGAVFEPLRDRLERQLGVTTVDYTYRSRWSFDRITKGFAERVAAVAGEGDLDIVAHSLGGLVARWYLQEQGGAQNVSRAVLLATPHQGTASAKLALGPLREALRPGGSVVRRLAAGRDRASSVAHTALVAGADLMVTPPASAAALADADVRWFDDVGHNAMLFHDGVHAAVQDALKVPPEGEPASE